MRGDDQKLQPGMFSYVALEDRIPQEHQLRSIRKLVDQVLAGMSKQFDGLYSEWAGRRFRRSGPCARRYYRCSTRSAEKTCSWSSSITTYCSAGSWAWR